MTWCKICGDFHRDKEHCHSCGALAISGNRYIDVATGRWIGRARGVSIRMMRRAKRIPQFVQMVARQQHLAEEN